MTCKNGLNFGDLWSHLRDRSFIYLQRVGPSLSVTVINQTETSTTLAEAPYRIALQFFHLQGPLFSEAPERKSLWQHLRHRIKGEDEAEMMFSTY